MTEYTNCYPFDRVQELTDKVLAEKYSNPKPCPKEYSEVNEENTPCPKCGSRIHHTVGDRYIRCSWCNNILDEMKTCFFEGRC